MSGISNFQDVVVLSSDTLSMGIERLIIGSDAGSKSFVFAQDPALASAMHLIASNPTAARTAILPNANGTIGYLTNISAGAGSISNGQIVFSDSNGIVWGANGSTFSAGFKRISNLAVGDYIRTINFGSSLSTLLASSQSNTTFSSGIVSGVRVSFAYPLNMTYLDPFGQRSIRVSGISNAGTWSVSESITWWCGLYTINGSTAGVVSSVSISSSVSLSGTNGSSSSVNIDGRFTNVTWNITPGDYMFFTGQTMSGSASVAGNTSPAHVEIQFGLTCAGRRQAEVSYSVPYWDNGSLSLSATSFHLSQLTNSGGVANTTLSPFVNLIGS